MSTKRAVIGGGWVALVLGVAPAACTSPSGGEDELAASTSSESGSETTSETTSGTSTDTTSETDGETGVESCGEPQPGQLCLRNTATLVSVIKPSTVVLGDVDDDGDLDALAIGISSSLLRVAPGLGNGEFGEWIDSTISEGARGAALGLVDDDLALDLVLANIVTPAGTGVAYGDGLGAFSQPMFLPTGAVRAVALGHFDGDAWLDAALANEDAGELRVLLGTGVGFASGDALAVELEPYDVVAGDLDLDGALDLASANQGSSSVSLAWGDGQGGFAVAQSVPCGAGPRGLALADLDLDGDLDIVTADFDEDAITLLRNRAEVEPRSFTTDSTLGVGASPYAVAAGDITGDGVPDLVSADSGANQISVLISQAGGWAPPVAFEVGFEPFDVALGELDGDGRLDVVTADFGGGSLSVLRTAE